MEFSSEFSFNAEKMGAPYQRWLGDVRPRTCLLMHWLFELGAVSDPGNSVHSQAKRFAEKRALLGRLVDRRGGEISRKTNWLIDNGEFDLYVAYLMWLRFNEYVPRRFVLPEGRARVLAWVRTQLHRPELTDSETVGELLWQAERLKNAWGGELDSARNIFEH